MASHHDHNDHHSNEKKPVAFTVPLIFASVIVFIIVMLVSIGDPKHGECCCKDESCSKECMEQCEKNGHHGGGDHKAAHMGDMKEEHSHEESADSMAVNTSKPEVSDSTAAKTEHKEEAHH
jgi:hypothetical protein